MTKKTAKAKKTGKMVNVKRSREKESVLSREAAQAAAQKLDQSPTNGREYRDVIQPVQQVLVGIARGKLIVVEAEGDD